MRRHLIRSRRLAGLALLCTGLICAAGALAQTTTDAARQAQRATFQKAYAAARRGDTQWHALAKDLESYPLYPWLPAAALEHDLAHVTPARVERYLKRYPDLLPAHDLRRRYLAELARRKDWPTFLALYRSGLGTTLACQALQARLATGHTLHWKDLADIWRHGWLPDACTPIQQWAHAHGLLTRERLWQRIDRAVAGGHGGTVAWLARWLVGRDRQEAKHLAQALRHPAAAVKAAVSWPDRARNRTAATLAMLRLARRDSDRADHWWPRLKRHFHFTTTQVHHIRAAMALYVATDFSDDALARLTALPAAAQTDTTRAWRVRVALAEQDWPAALAALDALTSDQKRQGEWRYWRARVLGELGRPRQARALYVKQAKQATYYGFLAADRAGVPYAICPRSFDADAALADKLLHRPALVRAFELFAVGLLHDARRVWNRALDGSSLRARQVAAHIAWQRGWYERAIRTFSHGTLKQLYRARFPLAREDGVDDAAGAADIDPAWAYAIIRAESAWAPDARSGANARGLMQLLPSTARLVARRQNIAFDGDLYDPRTNIILGTRYLAHMAARYGGAPYLATAAYNAGPARVDAWLTARGALPPDLFMATIPYHETRAYVMRVMAYSVIYDWRLHGNAVALDQRMPRFGQPYAPPTAATPRKSVACPD